MKLKPVWSVALQDYNMHTVMGMDDMTGHFTLGISSATFIDPSLANSMDAYTLVVRGQAGEGGCGMGRGTCPPHSGSGSHIPRLSCWSRVCTKWQPVVVDGRTDGKCNNNLAARGMKRNDL